MKKVILFIMVFICINMYAEDKVSEYTMSYFNKTYNIEATTVKNGEFKYYIYCQSMDRHELVGFSIDNYQIEYFIEQLRSIEGKFEEWSKTAKDNNITNYNKKFDTNFKYVNTFWQYGSQWCFSSAKFRPFFKVTDDGGTYAVIYVGEMTASSNEYMTSDGFLIVFASIDEIESFIKAIDPTHAINRTIEQSNKDNLFN